MELQTINRRSPRIQGYDYSSAGAYFVTICAQDRVCIFGEVDRDIVHLTPVGQIAADTWLSLGEDYPVVCLDEWVLMPNHLHAIILLEVGCPKPLGQIIGAYKSISRKRIKQNLGIEASIWQRNFHEHIIRSEKSLLGVRQYIRDNPAKWSVDKENLDALRQHDRA